MSDEAVEQLDKKPADEDPRDFVKRWLTEWQLAESNEKTWREQAKHCYEVYEGGTPTKDGRARTDRSFNILWSNTETLLPAVYNSAPQPDVRRRFRDADPLGKAVSLVLERGLSYAIDTEEFYDTLEAAVLDCIVVGRGVVRVKYEPKFAPIMGPDGKQMMGPAEAPGAEPQPMEQKVSEKTLVEHVQWDDFRRGPGKRWSQVPWIGFRHAFLHQQLVEMFGEEQAKLIPLNYPDGMANKPETEKRAFGSAEVIEIWDKEAMEVIFIATGWKDAPLLREPDPMQIDGFWPVPRPVMAIKNARSLVPRPMYYMYEVKARELERISQRINGIVRICKVRGVYDATMSEVQKLLDADDTDMIPVQNTAKYYRMGGLQKAIWMMPVGEIANILAALYQAQNECKQTIYELTGISDVIRGATEASETATAQRLKAQFGGLRLKTLQREVKRFGRDIMRLIADVMASKYDWQTFAEITGLQYPTAQEKQAAQAQLQQAQAMPPQADPATGQPMPTPPPDPAMLKAAQSPSWEEIMQVMQSDRQRCYKVDIETDSTIAETLEMDMQGLNEAVTGIMGFVSGAMPGVQSGVVSMDLVKSVALAMARRARLGAAVEDAIEQMQPPAPPQPDPAMTKAADEAKAGREESGKAMGEAKQMLQQIMQSLQAPKRIKAQANQMGEIEGEVIDG